MKRPFVITNTCDYKLKVSKTCSDGGQLGVWQGPMLFPTHLAWPLLCRTWFVHCTVNPRGRACEGEASFTNSLGLGRDIFSAPRRTKLFGKCAAEGMFSPHLCCESLVRLYQLKQMNEADSLPIAGAAVSRPDSHRDLAWKILVQVGMKGLDSYINMLLKCEGQKSKWQSRADLPWVMGVDDSAHPRSLGPLAQ